MILTTTTEHVSGRDSSISSFDYIELYVGNVRYAAHYYKTVWGFEPIAYRGLDTGSRDRTSIVLRQGDIVLVVTGAIDASSPIAAHLRLCGEGVATIGFTVDDVTAAYQCAVNQGASPVAAPTVLQDTDGGLLWAQVRSFDGFCHTLVDRKGYAGAFWPGFRALRSIPTSSTAFVSLDHVAVCVEAGTLERWVEFYQRVFGFTLGHREEIATESTGMNSRVVQNPSGSCKIPLVEPAPGARKSQVAEFLGFYGGPGVQHLALSTQNMRPTVRRLREHGVEFIRVPNSYYETFESRVGGLGGELADFHDLGILVDRDDSGYLLQTFTRSVNDRPTMFFEVIERRGALGFGAGNIRALFEAVEREQAMRGTL